MATTTETLTSGFEEVFSALGGTIHEENFSIDEVVHDLSRRFRNFMDETDDPGRFADRVLFELQAVASSYLEDQL